MGDDIKRDKGLQQVIEKRGVGSGQ